MIWQTLGKKEGASLADFNYEEYKSASTCGDDNMSEVSELDISTISSSTTTEQQLSIEPLHIKKEQSPQNDAGSSRIASYEP